MQIPEHLRHSYGHGIKVVVLDSGIDAETMMNMAAFGGIRSFVADGSTGDHLGHGTEVVRVIRHVAPHCEIAVGKIVDRWNKRWRTITNALEWCLKIEADVVNMSVAFSGRNRDMDGLLHELANRGTVVVAAHRPTRPSPHSHPRVLSVGVTGSGADMEIAHDEDKTPGWIHPSFRGSSLCAAIVSGIMAREKSRVRDYELPSPALRG